MTPLSTSGGRLARGLLVRATAAPCLAGRSTPLTQQGQMRGSRLGEDADRVRCPCRWPGVGVDPGRPGWRPAVSRMSRRGGTACAGPAELDTTACRIAGDRVTGSATGPAGIGLARRPTRRASGGVICQTLQRREIGPSGLPEGGHRAIQSLTAPLGPQHGGHGEHRVAQRLGAPHRAGGAWHRRPAAGRGRGRSSRLDQNAAIRSRPGPAAAGSVAVRWADRRSTSAKTALAPARRLQQRGQLVGRPPASQPGHHGRTTARSARTRRSTATGQPG